MTDNESSDNESAGNHLYKIKIPVFVEQGFLFYTDCILVLF